MELLHSRKKNVAFFSLIFALTATTALLAALGSKDVFIVKAASDKTLTITPSTNLFVGDTPHCWKREQLQKSKPLFRSFSRDFDPKQNHRSVLHNARCRNF
jgi:ABC-type sugar transport system substrate-binding protein